MLSDLEIIAELGKDIMIHPYSEGQVRPNSYDVRLGENFYEERRTYGEYFGPPRCNIYDRVSISDTWKPCQAEIEKDPNSKLYGKRVLWLAPGERVLGHTEEFIGGRGRITTTIKCRSSLGRSGLSVCLCAGSGDVGYFNRWTLEISNHLKRHSLPLVVGERVAQILFHRTGECARPYVSKYQRNNSLEELTRTWKPDMMLPRLYEDAQEWTAPDATHTEVIAVQASACENNTAPVAPDTVEPTEAS
jgi:dCTP deaminase